MRPSHCKFSENLPVMTRRQNSPTFPSVYQGHQQFLKNFYPKKSLKISVHLTYDMWWPLYKCRKPYRLDILKKFQYSWQPTSRLFPIYDDSINYTFSCLVAKRLICYEGVRCWFVSSPSVRALIGLEAIAKIFFNTIL